VQTNFFKLPMIKAAMQCATACASIPAVEDRSQVLGRPYHPHGRSRRAARCREDRRRVR